MPLISSNRIYKLITKFNKTYLNLISLHNISFDIFSQSWPYPTVTTSFTNISIFHSPRPFHSPQTFSPLSLVADWIFGATICSRGTEAEIGQTLYKDKPNKYGSFWNPHMSFFIWLASQLQSIECSKCNLCICSTIRLGHPISSYFCTLYNICDIIPIYNIYTRQECL